MADKVQAKIEARLKDRMKMVQALEKSIQDFATKINELTDHDLQTFLALTNADALFNDCPLSKLKTWHNIQEFMKKCDLDFIGFALDGKAVIPTLVDLAKDASKWAMRFAKEPIAPVTGIEAIMDRKPVAKAQPTVEDLL